ncbi:aminomethyl-transferring glycine dehydrogenase subunit GcvPA [Sedimentibacter sp. B4]|uniref:aminomethyl-transferring glycine dehydrogenase subunit GcvPA n=1 Tax=Sedimentibacter sp. B4 TaxID=304766 RepID=UPI00031134E4|nr:aminomethyl-transferring glycine dehydrogenase subunit GcvPA [Sedimentibacter sp. B4]
MSNKCNVVYPYIPNSVPEVKKAMLDELGMNSVEDIYKEIPERLRFKGEMNIPAPIHSEARLQRHVEDILSKNKNCKSYISFLGGGTWNHYVPAVCDTIGGRDEILTSYVGEAFSDHGKFQILFESESMLGDLTGFDACNTPTYDWANALAITSRMASRTTGRKEILVSEAIGPQRKLVNENYCKPDITVKEIKFDYENMCLDLEDLRSKISEDTACVYFENPNYLGFIETQYEEIVKIAHEKGALVAVGVDPTSLGILEAPGSFGADYALGELQPLGIHMSFGGGLGGFIACRDEEKFVAEYPSLLFGVLPTVKEGEYGFGQVAFERTSYGSREKGKDFIGTCAALHGMIAAVYLALMGPQGMKDLGNGILQRVAYAKNELSKIEGIKIYDACNFKEFVVNFDGLGKSVKEINKALFEKNIFGGIDLTDDFPALGNSALYAVTEMLTKDDIDSLVRAFREM